MTTNVSTVHRQKFVVPQNKRLKEIMNLMGYNQCSCIGNYFKNLQICMLQHSFEIHQALAIFTKFQIIIPKEELNISIFIIQCRLCKNTEFV